MGLGPVLRGSMRCKVFFFVRKKKNKKNACMVKLKGEYFSWQRSIRSAQEVLIRSIILGILGIYRSNSNTITQSVCLPVDGGYSTWSPWLTCDADCGGGIQERSRYCTNPAPQPGAKDCTVLGPDKETRLCNLFPCNSNF